MAPKAAATAIAAPVISRDLVVSTKRGVHLRFNGMGMADERLVELLLERRQEVIRKRKLDLRREVYFAIVDVSGNNITGMGLRSLLNFIEALELKARVLRLDHNCIDDAGVRELARHMEDTALPVEEVHLSHNRMTEASVRPLITAIVNHEGYPREGSDGSFVPLWLRLERNYIDVDAMWRCVDSLGCSVCTVHGRTSWCSATRCEKCTFQTGTTPQVHLAYPDEQNLGPPPKPKVQRAVLPKLPAFAPAPDDDNDVGSRPQPRTYADVLPVRHVHSFAKRSARGTPSGRRGSDYGFDENEMMEAIRRSIVEDEETRRREAAAEQSRRSDEAMITMMMLDEATTKVATPSTECRASPSSSDTLERLRSFCLTPGSSSQDELGLATGQRPQSPTAANLDGGHGMASPTTARSAETPATAAASASHQKRPPKKVRQRQARAAAWQ